MLFDLPPEIIDLVMQFLDYKDVVSCYKSSRLFHVISTPRMNRLKYENMTIGTIMRYNVIEAFKYQVNKMNKTYLLHSDICFKHATRFNRKEIIKYMLNNGFKAVSHHLNYAIHMNCLDLVEYMLQKYKIRFDQYSSYTAIQHCSIEELTRLLRLGIKYDNDSIDAAIRRNDYKIVRYLYDLGLRAPTLITAAKIGNIQVLKLLLQYPIANYSLSFNLAAKCGNIGAIKLLYINGAKGTDFAITQAVANNHLEVVRYLYFIGIPVKPVMTLFIKSVKMCRLLKVMGISCSKRGLLKMAERGDLELLEYIHKIGAPIFVEGETNPLDIANIFCNSLVVEYFKSIGYKPTV